MTENNFMANGDPFDGLFGGTPFNDLLDFLGRGNVSDRHKQGYQERSADDIRTEALIRTFNRRGDGERDFLSRAVGEYSDDVARLNRDDLYRAHGHAAVYAENLEAAVASFGKIVPNDRELAVIGLIAYDTSDFQKAEQDLGQVTGRIAQVRMALSSIKLNKGETRINEHVRLLAPVRKSSSAQSYLHTLLGINTFNHGDYASAESHFQIALDTIDTPDTQLNLMRAKFKQGKLDEVWSRAGKYMHDANLSDTNKLTEQLGIDQIEFPRYVVNKKTLYDILA